MWCKQRVGSTIAQPPPPPTSGDSCGYHRFDLEVLVCVKIVFFYFLTKMHGVTWWHCCHMNIFIHKHNCNIHITHTNRHSYVLSWQLKWQLPFSFDLCHVSWTRNLLFSRLDFSDKNAWGVTWWHCILHMNIFTHNLRYLRWHNCTSISYTLMNIHLCYHSLKFNLNLCHVCWEKLRFKRATSPSGFPSCPQLSPEVEGGTTVLLNDLFNGNLCVSV